MKNKSKITFFLFFMLNSFDSFSAAIGGNDKPIDLHKLKHVMWLVSEVSFLSPDNKYIENVNELPTTKTNIERLKGDLSAFNLFYWCRPKDSELIDRFKKIVMYRISYMEWEVEVKEHKCLSPRTPLFKSFCTSFILHRPTDDLILAVLFPRMFKVRKFLEDVTDPSKGIKAAAEGCLELYEVAAQDDSPKET